jgi:4-hydroxybenzoate polyprenyltransferase
MLNANQDLFTEMKYKAVFKEFSEITLYWMLGLSLFFFLVTLAREITKDIVDMKGDAAFRCKTMPIVLGISKTKWVVVALYLITIGLLIFAKEQYLNNKITAIYFYLLLTPLLGVIIALTIKGKSPEQFKLPSTLNKVTSVIGVLFLVIAYMELNGLW